MTKSSFAVRKTDAVVLKLRVLGDPCPRGAKRLPYWFPDIELNGKYPKRPKSEKKRQPAQVKCASKEAHFELWGNGCLAYSFLKDVLCAEKPLSLTLLTAP